MLIQRLIAANHHFWPKIDSPTQKIDQVDIWAIYLPKQAKKPQYEQLHQQKKARHHILKRVLSYYLSHTPQESDFEQTPKGKPYLNSHPLQFNLSHSQNHLFIALHANKALGIDIEVLKKRHIEHFSRRFFGDTWFEHSLQGHPHYLQLIGFFQAWTQTEAWIKAHGETVFNFSDFKPLCFPQSGIRDINSTWQMLSWMPQVGLMCSLCFPKDVNTFRYQVLDLTQAENYTQFMQGASL